MTHKATQRCWWTFAITSLALFMVTLDNLVVTTALPVIRRDLHAGPQRPRVDGQRLHAHLRRAAPDRRRARRPLRPPRACSRSGSAIFTLASAAAALAPSIGALDAARAVQGLGGAIVMPLTLTILSAAVPAERRGLALGAWGGISGLAVALGPLVGGAVVSGISWHWIFWLNVPIGLVLAPLALLPAATRRTGPRRGSTCRASASRAPASSGSSGASCAATRSAGRSPRSSARSSAAPLVLGAFVCWELRTPTPMLPMRFFRNRTFALAERLEPLHVLRDVRLDLPARAVLPDGAGLLAARSPGCGSCRGRRCRSSSRRSPARSPTGSAATS